jgi:hypothetical protein
MQPPPDSAPPESRLRALRAAAPALQHAANNALMVLGANLDLLARGGEAASRQAGRARSAAEALEALLRAYLGLMRAPGAALVTASPAATVAAVRPLLVAALGSRTPLRVEGAAPPLPHDPGAVQATLLDLALAIAGQGEPGAALTLTLSEAGITATPPAGTRPEGVIPMR